MIKKCVGEVPEMRNDSVILCVMYRIVRATINNNLTQLHLLLNEPGEARHSGGKKKLLLRDLR